MNSVLVMIEKMAWKEIGYAYYTARYKRTPFQIELTTVGICDSIFILYISEKISSDTAAKMEDVIAECIFNDQQFKSDVTGERYNNLFSNYLRGDFCISQYYRLGGKR